MIKKLNISDTNIKILKMLFIMFCIAMIVGFILIPDKKNYLFYVIGLILGVFVCAMKMILLEKMLDKAIDMDEKSAQKYVVSQFAFRHLSQLLVLVGVAILLPVYALFGTFASFACLSISVYTANYFIKEKSLKKHGLF